MIEDNKYKTPGENSKSLFTTYLRDFGECKELAARSTQISILSPFLQFEIYFSCYFDVTLQTVTAS